MNKEIFERLAQIDKELNEIERNEEEENMKNELEEIFNNELTEFVDSIDDTDFEIYNEYVRVTNEENANIIDLFKQLTPEGAALIIEIIIKGYLWNLLHDGNIKISRHELENFKIMLDIIRYVTPNNKNLQLYIVGLIVAVKGGE